MHMWHHVTNHLIISNDKDSNSETNEKLCVRDTQFVSIVQEAFNTTHLNISYMVTAHNDIVMMVHLCLWPHTQTESTASVPTVIQSAQNQVLIDCLRCSEACQNLFQRRQIR
jgi:hypothetical protein